MDTVIAQLKHAKKGILSRLSKDSRRVLTLDDLKQLLSPQNRERLGLPDSISVNKVIQFLSQESELAVAKFEFPSRSVYRYLRGQVPAFEVIQSLKPESYFSHYSAVYLHGLTDQVPKTVYLNFEQQMTAGGGELSQEAIHRAFKGKCRTSNNTAPFDKYLVTLLNGSNTGQLGVTDVETSEGSRVRVTNVERTLIDITVRPVYSGGVFEVARAFDVARDRVSVPRLVRMLRKLNYTYPYHQSIGYYLERAGGYKPAELDQLREFPMDFDFYLEYAMRQTEYNARWRLLIPKGF